MTVIGAVPFPTLPPSDLSVAPDPSAMQSSVTNLNQALERIWSVAGYPELLPDEDEEQQEEQGDEQEDGEMGFVQVRLVVCYCEWCWV